MNLEQIDPLILNILTIFMVFIMYNDLRKKNRVSENKQIERCITHEVNISYLQKSFDNIDKKLDKLINKLIGDNNEN